MVKTGLDNCSRNSQFEEATKAVLLVGGLGTRLRSVVPSTPKALAGVGNKSFLELLIRQLQSQGYCRLVMCTGYLADQIESQFGNGQDCAVTIEYSRESNPLGTAGAVKLASRHLRGLSDFLVMNGDSYLAVDLHQLLQFHRGHGGLISIAVIEARDASRYGTVQVDSAGRLIRFLEKTGEQTPGLINAGVYVFSQAVLQHIPEGMASLENTLFPKLITQGIYAFKQDGFFIDIGTPEDYARAQELCDRFYQPISAR